MHLIKSCSNWLAAELVLVVAGLGWNVWVWGSSDVSAVVFRGWSSFLLLSLVPGLQAHCNSPNKGIGGGRRNAALDLRVSFPLVVVKIIQL